MTEGARSPFAFVLLMAVAMSAVARPANAEGGYILPDGRVRIVGYNDMDEMLTAILRPLEHATGTRFALDLRSTRAAPGALIDGTSLLAPMGVEMEPDDRVAVRAAWGGDPIEFRIAHDSLDRAALSSPRGILVAATNPLRTIDIRRARRVFVRNSGSEPITRWGELGATGAWAERPIHPVGMASDTAIGRFVLRHSFAASDYVANYAPKRQSRDVVAGVAADTDAIGLANLNHANGAVRALAITDNGGVVRQPTRQVVASGRYPLDRYLLVYARTDREGHIDPLAGQVLRAVLSAPGQAAIARGSRGYIPLASAERHVELIKLENALK